MNTKVIVTKMKEDAIVPSKRVEDAGFDIYCCLPDAMKVINPHETVMLPTGIATACDPDYCFVLKERGSTGSKGLGQRCGVIDSGYRGEWFVPITNHNDKAVMIYKDHLFSQNELDNLEAKYILYPTSKAITQAMVIPVPRVNIEEVSFDVYKNIGSERGLGALGSSGK